MALTTQNALRAIMVMAVKKLVPVRIELAAAILQESAIAQLGG